MPVNYLSVEKLSKSFNEKSLFENLTFGLEQGQKAALIGVNGCGKSTLLNIISGKDSPDSGGVSFLKDIVVKYLDQSPDLGNFNTILDSIFDSAHPEAQVIKAYNLLIEKENPTDAEQEKIHDLLSEIDSLNAWNYEHRAKEILGKLGIKDLERNISDLSGGQKKRIALARVLIDKPDLLILDEPTNHLDLEIIEWLENYLSTANMSILMVTHDRYFLDKVTTEIIEIENGQLYKFKGNYSSYLEQKAEREEMQQASKDKARNLMKKELEWMRRQPKARGTKAKYRVDAFEDVKDKATVNLSKNELEIKVSGSRQGKKIIELDKISKAYGATKIFEDFSYVFKRGEKLGVVGKNGTGKSTFLNVLTGKLKPDSGILDKGLNTKFGYYTQDEIVVKANQKVIDIVKEVAEVITLDDGSTVTASQLLNLFLFPPKSQYDFVSKLSGGEKSRLQLLRVLMSNPNFLILDEPTNDLDIVTLNILEDYLQKFSGCLILVSHDRYFMDKLVDHLFVLDNSTQISDFPGNYTDYRLQEQDQIANKQKEPKQSTPTKVEEKPKEEKKKLSYIEQREYKALESDISKLESNRDQLTTKLNSGVTDHNELAAWSSEIETINSELEEKEMRWLELSEKA
ncbi:MAG: ABC-F family ATP-binding cassette domain-containing protein [Cyclobacteriaceae bacterium]|nr:ABC-F family ATP-binding cassette domain-containing protein [Cyclobacteriaceae bacterium]